MNRPWLKFYDDNVILEPTYPELTLPDILNRTVATYPDFIATTMNDLDITYRELNGKVNGFAHALKRMGVKKGDRVALLLPNSPTYIIAFYGIVKLGAIVANLNVMSQGSELVRSLNGSGSEIVITLDIFLNNVVQIVEETAVREIVIHSVFNQEKELEYGEACPDIHILNDLVAANPLNEPAPACVPEDIAVLQYTSGSTGEPKAAVLTHRNIVSNVIQVYSWNPLPQRLNEAILCMIPFFQVFGMTICLHLSIYMGLRMVLYPMFDWSNILNILKDIKKYRPISFPAVPALWAALVTHTEAGQHGLSAIDVATGGGAPLPVWVQEKFQQLTGKKIAQAYGLSEVSSSTHITPFGGKTTIYDSIGLPLPDTDVRIVDIETGEAECSVGEVGEMIIKGPQVMQGYWNDPERTRETIRQGWLYTGDLARMDEKGYFYLVDRKDDLIISRGFNVYPSDIESVLKKHPAVQDAAVIGSPDKMRGEAIVAYVVLKDGETVDNRELLDCCRDQLPAYKVPRFIRLRDEIPANRVGKPLRRILREEDSELK
ncbi:MAG: long-chain fatty acid--CoA ligase [Deltaproteobacteria bacterium]|jgi:long-chain acyl-CoA synthetase|nr:long-chain fatty acid--CoA ligase [Deltaproteobacteria bacterium]MBT6504343.1 long-chain fatty acid--CoA ligase [Deltaproteobacteria bacterium]MBT7154571.1 long-chain fatty acid--CoA ligase [Deltaproteobacteria bacterium]MBT7716422.1 long-chain fatty acid--CoA ligase [Deltaproteobacteria bacterium]MBT7892902.1 long-chain fatty acid--CoA ligase [Deltaproteobacteria bacterium]